MLKRIHEKYQNICKSNILGFSCNHPYGSAGFERHDAVSYKRLRESFEYRSFGMNMIVYCRRNSFPRCLDYICSIISIRMIYTRRIPVDVCKIRHHVFQNPRIHRGGCMKIQVYWIYRCFDIFHGFFSAPWLIRHFAAICRLSFRP